MAVLFCFAFSVIFRLLFVIFAAAAGLGSGGLGRAPAMTTAFAKNGNKGWRCPKKKMCRREVA